MSALNPTRQYDIILFGATGVTGFYAIRELYQSTQCQEYSRIKWAIAGRRLDKLDQALAELSEELNADLSLIPKLYADVFDDKSIEAMVGATKVLLNCVGPYDEYGRPVVEACIRSGTHHLDLSAELQYIEGTQIECHEAALKSDTLIVSACGFCSVIPEMGLALARKHFSGTLHSVESYVDMKHSSKGYSVNFGTFHSIMYFFVNIAKMVPIRRQLSEQFFTQLPTSRITQRRWPMRFPFSSNAKGLSVIFPIPDHSVVDRTKQYNYQHYGERPLQYGAYYRLRMWRLVLAWPILCLICCKCGRGLLKRHIGCLSGGVISKNGPSREQVEKNRFSLRIVAKGWRESCEKAEQEPSGKRDAKMVIKISGGDPPYAMTACAVVQAGLTILADREQMPRGGVLTVGSAFRNTHLWERLQQRGIKVEILSGNGAANGKK